MVKYQVRGSSVIKHKAKAADAFMDGCVVKKRASILDEKGGSVTGVRTSDNEVRQFIFAHSDDRCGLPPFPTRYSWLQYFPRLLMQVFQEDLVSETSPPNNLSVVSSPNNTPSSGPSPATSLT